MIRESVPYTGDRLRVDYTSGVSAECRLAVRASILTTLGHYGYWHAEHFDRTACAWSIEATPYDPNTPRPITDGQVAGLLQSIARERGVSVAQLVEAARKAL